MPDELAKPPPGVVGELGHAMAESLPKVVVAANKTPRFAIVTFAIVLMFGFWLAYMYLSKNVASGGGPPTDWMRSQEVRIQLLADRLTSLETDQRNDRLERQRAEEVEMKAIDKLDAKIDRLIERPPR